jgi:hypothetical protein
VRDRRIQTIHDLDADDGGQVFFKPILLSSVSQKRCRVSSALRTKHAIEQFLCLRIATHFHALRGINRCNLRQKRIRHATRHQQAFCGIARRVFICLRVIGHLSRHLNIARIVHIHMAVAIQVFDHGHFRIAADALNQAFAAARNDHVHKLRHRNQLPHRFAIRRGHELHAVFRQTTLT